MVNRRYKTNAAKRRMFVISNIDKELMAKIRLYAIAKDMPLYQAAQYLIRLGFAAETGGHPSKLDPIDMMMIIREPVKQ